MNHCCKSVVGMVVFVLALGSGTVDANNLQITNVTVTGNDVSTAYIQFDISWENSWRYTNINHDAAWVFFKVQEDGSTEWHHAILEGTGIGDGLRRGGRLLSRIWRI